MPPKNFAGERKGTGAKASKKARLNAEAGPAEPTPAPTLKRKAPVEDADEGVGAPSPPNPAPGRAAATAVGSPAHPRTSGNRAASRTSSTAQGQRAASTVTSYLHVLSAGQPEARGTRLDEDDNDDDSQAAPLHSGGFAAGPLATVPCTQGSALAVTAHAGAGALKTCAAHAGAGAMKTCAACSDGTAGLFHQQLQELVELALRSRLMEFQWEHERNDQNPSNGRSIATLRTTSVNTMRVCGLEVSPFLGCSHMTPCPHRLEFAAFEYDDTAKRAFPVVHVYAEVVLEGVVVPSSRVYVNQHVVVRDQLTSTEGPNTQTYIPIAYQEMRSRDVQSTLTHTASSSTDHFVGSITRVTTYRRPKFVPGLSFTELAIRFNNSTAGSVSDVSEERTLATSEPTNVTLHATHRCFQAPATARAGVQQQGWRQLVTLAYTPLEGAEHAFAPQPWSDQPVEVGYQMGLEVVAAGILRDDANLRDCPRYTISIATPFQCDGLPRSLSDQKVRVPHNITVPGYTRIPDTDGEYFTRDSDYWSRYRPQNPTINIPFIGSFRPSQYVRSDGTILYV